MCMTEPLSRFSPSSHAPLQVLRRSLKPTVKLLSVQTAYKEFIQKLLFYFLMCLNDCVAWFSRIAAPDMCKTTLSSLYQWNTLSKPNLHSMDRNYATLSRIGCYSSNIYLFTTVTPRRES